MPNNLLAGSTSITSSLPSSVLNGITGYNNIVGGLVGGIPIVPQYFFTVPFANNQPVMYMLELNPVGTTTSTTTGSTDTFIFPLTPSNVTKQVINLTNYYDVQGNNTNYGVQRIIDQYGLTPPIITISGTTGFQFHSLDQYQWSGRSSFARLVSIIQAYASQVATAISSEQPSAMPILQFTDSYTAETYNVVPLNQQAYSMDVSRPIIQTYNLVFLAQATQTPQSISLSQQDPIVQAFILSKALLTAGLLSWWNSALGSIFPEIDVIAKPTP
jgi:hypothetical protein